MTVPIIDFPDWQQPSGLPNIILAANHTGTMLAHGSTTVAIAPDEQGAVTIYQALVSTHVQMRVGPFMPTAGAPFASETQCNAGPNAEELWLPVTFYGDTVDVTFDNPEATGGTFALSVYKAQGVDDDELVMPSMSEAHQVLNLSGGDDSPELVVPFAGMYDRITATLIAGGPGTLNFNWCTVAILPTPALIRDTDPVLVSTAGGTERGDVPVSGAGLAWTVHNDDVTNHDYDVIWRAYRVAS